jgi:putative ABC transport system substrate-binding protein
LVGLPPDIILADSIPATVAVQRLTRTIPIIFVLVSDPVASGIVTKCPFRNFLNRLNLLDSKEVV